MPAEKIDARKYMRGDVRLHSVPDCSLNSEWRRMFYSPDVMSHPAFGGLPPGWKPLTGFEHNDFLYEWGAIFANLLTRRGLNYGIGGMYIEFENTASPGDPVSAPAFTRDAGEGVEYYNGLALSSDRDYLRVPLVASTIDSTDEANFPKGNRPIFFAQTSGVEGVHGKPFSDVNNSTVFGGALVAFVDADDPTRDIVLSRFYVSTARQQVKLSTSQIGFEWRVSLL